MAAGNVDGLVHRNGVLLSLKGKILLIYALPQQGQYLFTARALLFMFLVRLSCGGRGDGGGSACGEGANALAGWRAGHEVSHEAAPAARKDMTEYKTPHLDEAVVDATTAEEEGSVTGPHVGDLANCPVIKCKSHGRWETRDPRCQRQDHTAALLVFLLSLIAELALEEGQVTHSNLGIDLNIFKFTRW